MEQIPDDAIITVASTQKSVSEASSYHHSTLGNDRQGRRQTQPERERAAIQTTAISLLRAQMILVRKEGYSTELTREILNQSVSRLGGCLPFGRTKQRD